MDDYFHLMITLLASGVLISVIYRYFITMSEPYCLEVVRISDHETNTKDNRPECDFSQPTH